MKNVLTQHHTAEEVIELLRNNKCAFTDEESRYKLADWLEQRLQFKGALSSVQLAIAVVHDQL